MLTGVETVRVERATSNGIVVEESDFLIEDNKRVRGVVHDRFYK